MPQPGGRGWFYITAREGAIYILSTLSSGIILWFFSESLQILLSDLDVLSAVISKGQKFLKKGGELWLMAQCRSPTIRSMRGIFIFLIFIY